MLASLLEQLKCESGSQKIGYALEEALEELVIM